MSKNDIGLIGLAVMGQNLALNMADNGYKVAVYNRTAQKTQEFMDGEAGEKPVQAAYSLSEFVDMLETPRRVILMVQAGGPVDKVIEALIPLMSPGDVIMDGGNSHFPDTERRFKELAPTGIHYLGVGVSGGEEGARNGPSIMPGGPHPAWEIVEPILTAISAKAENEPCVAHMGNGGAGHFVKMVHNGIEYGDMQLIAETYAVMKHVLGLGAAELHAVFKDWNEGVLSSYLVEITADIFTVNDEETGAPLVEKILDKAGQKGTGRWTVAAALDLGVPVPTITAAVEARALSSYKDERSAAAEQISGPSGAAGAGLTQEDLAGALYAAKICSYAQGFALMKAADEAHGFDLDYKAIARIWRAGCIIRARFLNDVTAAFEDNPELANLLMAPFFQEAVAKRHDALRKVVAAAALSGVAAPALASSLAYLDGYRTARGAANLLQAQRDYFGAHTYERIDKSGVFHTDWINEVKR